MIKKLLKFLKSLLKKEEIVAKKAEIIVEKVVDNQPVVKKKTKKPKK